MRRASFIRKVLYMGVMLGLFLVMFPVRYSIEYIRSPKYQATHRDVYLSEATLGSVDPTSAAALFLLGGLRGIASSWIWIHADELQRNHDWANLAVDVDRMIKLQPHFITVWTFQSWNLAYNVSVEWDSVDDKYYWIREGIRFAQRGTEVNQHSPELRFDTGWYYFHKIGKADEAVLLRRAFRDDSHPELNSQGNLVAAFNPRQLDNYQAAGEWFERAIQKVEELRIEPRRMGRVPFYSYPAHAKSEYAIGYEVEGQFGEPARRNWEDALVSWRRFGELEYPVHEGKVMVRLEYPGEIDQPMFESIDLGDATEQLRNKLKAGSAEQKPEERQALTKQFEELALRAERFRQSLQGVDQRFLDNLPAGARAPFEKLWPALDRLKQVRAADIIATSTAADEARARFNEFAEALAALRLFTHEEMYWCDRYSSMVNHRYWKSRCVAEMETDTILARENFFRAQEAARPPRADLETAKKQFEEGIARWERILDKHPRFRDDDLTVDDTAEMINGRYGYLALLRQLDLPKPEKVPFADLIKRREPPPMAAEMQQIYDQLKKSGLTEQQIGQEMQKRMRQMEESQRKQQQLKAGDREQLQDAAKRPVPAAPATPAPVQDPKPPAGKK